METATITITIPGSKPGHFYYYRIEFKKSDFNKVIATVPTVRTPAEMFEIEKQGLWFVKY